MVETLTKLVKAPAWVLQMLAEVETQRFGLGFDHLTSETRLLIGTTVVVGADAIKSYFKTVNEPLNSRHAVHDVWASAKTVIVMGDVRISHKADPDKIINPSFVQIFNMTLNQPSQVDSYRVIVGPIDM